MRIRLVSVVREFLWSGERSDDHNVRCFPWWSLISIGHTDSDFTLTILPAIYIDLASH